MDLVKTKNFRKQVYSSKISLRPYHHLIGKLYLIQCDGKTSIEFRIVVARIIQSRVSGEVESVGFRNGEIELFFDYLLSNETYFEYRNATKNSLICAEKVSGNCDIFGLYIANYNNKLEYLEMVELESKHEFDRLLKKIKWLSEKIKVLRDEHSVLMYDKDSTVYINSTGTMLDLDEVKADKFRYEDIKLRKVGKIFQICT
jgi:hypothetical protein